jgi:hypothetical protein
MRGFILRFLKGLFGLAHAAKTPIQHQVAKAL